MNDEWTGKAVKYKSNNIMSYTPGYELLKGVTLRAHVSSGIAGRALTQTGGANRDWHHLAARQPSARSRGSQSGLAPSGRGHLIKVE